MRKQVFSLLVCLPMLACGLLACKTTPTLTPPPQNQGLCGNGICDEAEKANPKLCPQDCDQATLPPTSAPAVQCGDGRCEGTEDGQNCPQDCISAATTTPLPVSGMPDYEPPINVFLILHIDPIGDMGAKTFKPEEFMYTRTRDEIDWLMTESARHGLRFTSLYNGWYPKWSVEHNDLDQYSALLAAGHDVGSHAHQITYDPEQDLWVTQNDVLSIYGRPNYDPDLARQSWNDADQYVEAVLQAIGATGQNQTMCSTALSLPDERNLMAEFGFTIAAGNRLEAGVSNLGHMIWNPWRAANSEEPGYEIAEDLSAPYISFNHGAQIGGAEAHGTDVTVPQLQRQFLMLYAEWLARERTGAEDHVWSFGFVYHPNMGDRYNDALVEFLDWLDQSFIGKTSPYGHTIARYALVGEVAAEFLAWEAAHPGVSSFNYVSGDPYPYTYAALAQKLASAAYEEQIDLGEGVNCYRFTKDNQTIFMCWSDQGERTIDFSNQLSGQVQATSGSGQQSSLEAAALPLTEEPILMEAMP
ncbi:MAG: hypothetical protein JXB15_12215 [Anaerolineales bacterium]|nr:hypothetical protein [Anaerolineales bacterium]